MTLYSVEGRTNDEWFRKDSVVVRSHQGTVLQFFYRHWGKQRQDTFRSVFATSTECKSGNLLLHQFSLSDCLFLIDTVIIGWKICWLSEQLLSSEGRMCQIKSVILKRKHKCIGIGNVFSALVGTLLVVVFYHRFMYNNTQIPATNT
jgi:hypothetical protein